MNAGFKNLVFSILHRKMNKALIIIGLFSWHCQISFCSTDIQVQPDEIYFNYNVNGYSDDALTISDEDANTITAPEWKYNATGYYFAYVKGQTNLKVKVKFRSNLNGTEKRMHLLINLSITAGDGIGSICNWFVENYSPTDYVILSLQNSSVPNSIGIREFTWRWEIYAIPFDPAYCSAATAFNTYHDYFTLLAQPLAPVSEPWSNVLILACDWASGKTSEAEAVAEITSHSYEYFGINRYYNSANTHTNYRTFHLKSFLNQNWQDCQDMSAVVQVFTWMMGGSETRVRKIDSTLINFEDICHDSIQLIGNTVFTGRWYWNFHQVVWFNNKIFDACIKLNPYNPRIPINEDIGINGTYYNDLHYSYGCQKSQYDAWDPKEPFFYSTID